VENLASFFRPSFYSEESKKLKNKNSFVQILYTLLKGSFYGTKIVSELAVIMKTYKGEEF
jgi:hypothetical protein